MPHEHIGMNGAVAHVHSHIKRTHTVFNIVVRTVAHTEHITESAHVGAYVILSEFNQDIRFD